MQSNHRASPSTGEQETTVQPVTSGMTSPPVTIRKVTVAAAVGTFVENFDLVAYGALAATLSRVFFPASDGATGVLQVFAVFALAFVARPLGALVWGPVGDCIGRRRTLAINIMMMTAATAVIGLLPPHASIGFWAPLALVVCRLVQGLSAGGEIPGAAIFVGEYAATDRRARTTSYLQWAITFAELAALLLSTLIVSVLPDEQLLSWGWRVPFLVAAPIGVVGIYIRSRLEETPVFDEIERAGSRSRSPLSELLATGSGWRMVGRAVLFILPCMAPGYLLLTFMPTYLTKSAGMPQGNSVLLVTLALLALVATIPAGAALSDRYGRRVPLIVVSAAQFALALPAFLLIQQGGLVLTLVALLMIAVPFGMARATQIPPVLESFPTRARFTGFALSLGMSVALVAGPTPYAAAWLTAVTGSVYAPAWLIMAIVVPSLVGSFFVRESRGMSLRE